MDWINHHPDIEFNYLRRGGITCLLGGRHVVLRQGDVAIFWAAQPHQVIITAGNDLIDWIYVPLQTFLAWGVDQQAVNKLLAGQVLGGGGSPETDALIFDRWHRDLNSQRPEAIKATVLETMVYIAANSHRELSVSGLALRSGLHPDYLGRIFYQRFNQTIVQAITRHRLFRAQRLLLSGVQEITTIAFSSGFGSLSQFNKVFKDYMGVSPRAFRARHVRQGA